MKTKKKGNGTRKRNKKNGEQIPVKETRRNGQKKLKIKKRNRKETKINRKIGAH